jgi:OTU domain-containing protein 5
MTRIYVQRGSSAGSNSTQNTNSNPNPNRAGSSSARPEHVTQVQSVAKDEESGEEELGLVVGDDVVEYAGSSNRAKSDDPLMESLHFEENDTHTPLGNEVLVDLPGKDVKEEVEGLQESRERPVIENEGLCEGNPVVSGGGGSSPPPPPVPPPKPSSTNLNSRRSASGSPNAVNAGSPRRGSAWPVVVSARTSPAGSRPSSPRAHSESEGYNSADEQNPCYVSSYDDVVS